MGWYEQSLEKFVFLPQQPSVLLVASQDGTLRQFDLRCDSTQRRQVPSFPQLVHSAKWAVRGPP